MTILLYMQKNPQFTERVLSAVSKIPKGQVTTYVEIATKAGRPKAYRAVGSILRKNTNLKIPCHRVILSNGILGNYNGLMGRKNDILKREGYIKKP